ncbi:MAG: fluoride efflux transporter CrcB [Caulobacteraceae bacterium]|nr:fluoride efflux transporter CrcB [Caulobacteraceae bacterium]
MNKLSLELVLVFLGGGTGSIARYLVGMQTLRLFGSGWPYGTFTVNVVGGFLMGSLVGFLAHRGGVDQDRWRVLLGVGVLGGFTTFSAFSVEVALMIERRAYANAAGYVAASFLLAITAVFVGLSVSRRLFA